MPLMTCWLYRNELLLCNPPNPEQMRGFYLIGLLYLCQAGPCCRVQYSPPHQQNLIAALSNITSTDGDSLPVLLQANAFISDILHLSFSGNINPSAILDLAATVAAALVSHTGFGLHLMVAPVVEALQQLTQLSMVSSPAQLGREHPKHAVQLMKNQ